MARLTECGTQARRQDSCVAAFTVQKLLHVTVLAAVKAALTGGNLFLALRGDGNPVLNLCVPVQIAVINYLAFFQDPRASRGRGYRLFCLTHK